MPMTRTETRAYGVVTPSSRQPLLEAMLRAFLWLVSNVVSLSGLFFNRRNRHWHTGAASEDQLPTSNDIQKETFSATNTGAFKALMVISTQSVRLSNHAYGMSVPDSAFTYRDPRRSGRRP